MSAHSLYTLRFHLLLTQNFIGLDQSKRPAVHPDSTSLPERPAPPVLVSTQAIPWFSLTAEAATPWHWRQFMVRFRMHSSPGERIQDRGHSRDTTPFIFEKCPLHLSSLMEAYFGLKSGLILMYIIFTSKLSVIVHSSLFDICGYLFRREWGSGSDRECSTNVILIFMVTMGCKIYLPTKHTQIHRPLGRT